MDKEDTKITEEELLIYIDNKEFWRVTKNIDWRLYCEERKYYEKVSKELLQEYGEDGLKDLNKKCYHFSICLVEQLHRYAKAHYNSWIDFCKATGFVHGLSDDSEWYLCTFIVGCGKEKYDKVMLDPTRISEFKDYTEGFIYCFIK